MASASAMSVPGRMASQRGLARGHGQARIDHHHFRAIADAPVVDHAEVNRSRLCLVVTEINVQGSRTDVLRGVAVAAADRTLRKLERDALGAGAERIGALVIGGSPQLGEQPRVAGVFENAGARADERGQRIGTVRIAHPLELLRNLIERLVPADALEASLAAFANPLLRELQPVLAVLQHRLGGRTALERRCRRCR
jgi:hypothetical protein